MHVYRIFFAQQIYTACSQFKVIKRNVNAKVYAEGRNRTQTFLIVNFFQSDGKYLVLPSGELHIREVGPEDGYKSYQCRTKHRLTGETRLSATKGRLVITGKFAQVPNVA